MNKKQKIYKVFFSRDEYGFILMKANSKQEAQDLFDSGEFDEKDLVYKGGSMVADSVELYQ